MSFRSRSKSTQRKDSHSKSFHSSSTAKKYFHKSSHSDRNRSIHKSSRRRRNRSSDREHRHRRIDKHSHRSRYRSSSDSESSTDNPRISPKSPGESLVKSDLREEFERSAFDKAYGLDISGFVGISSEILTATSVSEGTKLTRSDRRKHREHELKHHQERFWKCKRCEFMNYLSNYECKHCKTLRHTST